MNTRSPLAAGVHIIPADPPHELVLPEVVSGVPYLIVDVSAQDFMMRVAADPGPGQYRATGNVYTFCGADAGHEVVAERVISRPD